MRSRAERFFRFIINRIMKELELDLIPRKTKTNPAQPPKRSILSQHLFNIIGISAMQSCRCSQGHLTTKQNNTFVLEMNWSSSSSSSASSSSSSTAMTFASVIQRSLCGESQTMSWCETCHKDGEGVSDKTVATLPQYIVMMIGQPNEMITKVRKRLFMIIIMIMTYSYGLAVERE